MLLAMVAGGVGVGAWSETGKYALYFNADVRLNGMADLKLRVEDA